MKFALAAAIGGTVVFALWGFSSIGFTAGHAAGFMECRAAQGGE